MPGYGDENPWNERESELVERVRGFVWMDELCCLERNNKTFYLPIPQIPQHCLAGQIL